MPHPQLRGDSLLVAVLFSSACIVAGLVLTAMQFAASAQLVWAALFPN